MPKTHLPRLFRAAPTTFLPVLVLLLLCLATLPIAAQEVQPGQRTSHLELQELDRQLQGWLVEVRDTEPTDKDGAEQLATWRTRVAQLDHQLDELLASGLPPAKVDALRALAHNFRLAVEFFQEGRFEALEQLPTAGELPVTSGSRTGMSDKVAPTNDDCANALSLALGQIRTGNLSEATADGESNCSAAGGRDVWFRYTALETGFVSFSSLGSDFDTTVSVHRSCPGFGVNQVFGASNEVTCSDDSVGLQGIASLLLPAGDEVLIRLAGFDAAAAGEYQIRAGSPPTVAGKITSDEDGSPLRAQVALCNRDFGFFIASTLTDAETGDYRLGRTPAFSPGFDVQDAYLHSRQAREHINEAYDDIQLELDSRFCGTEQIGTVLPLRTGSHLNGIDLQLARGGAISGQIFNADGTPATPPSSLQVIVVRVYDEQGRLYASRLTLDGSYRLAGMPTGEYFVQVNRDTQSADGTLYGGVPCPTGCDPLQGQAVQVQAGQESSGIDVFLTDDIHIYGRVTDSHGQAVEGARLQLLEGDRDSQFIRTTSTDADGNYILRNLPAWSYLLQVSADGFVTQLFDGAECPPDSCPLTQLVGLTVIDLQRTGRHYPSLRADFRMQSEADAFSGSAFAGRVTDTEGTPLAERLVLAFDPDRSRTVFTRTADDGSYLLVTEPGTTYFLYTDSSRTHEDQLYGGKTCPLYTTDIRDSRCQPLDGEPLEAQSSVTPGIDFQLVPHPRIEGTVKDVDGLPFVGVEVVATRSPEYRPFPTLTNQTTTDAEGRYSLPVPAGDHFLYFSKGIMPQVLGAPPCDDLFNVFSCPTEGATAVAVEAADVTGVDLQARGFGTLTGRVLDMAGQPVSDGSVLLRNDLGVVLGSGTPNLQGEYEIGGIPVGKHWLEYSGAGWVGELYDNLPCLPSCPPLEQGLAVNFTGSRVPQTGFDFQLDALAVLHARFVDATNGAKLSDPDLQLWHAGSGEPAHVLRRTVDGEFEFFDIQPGSYRLSASRFGYNGQIYGGSACTETCTSAPDGDILHIGLGDVISGIEFRLVPFGAISGRITGAFTGRGTSSDIVVWASTGQQVTTASSSQFADGNYTTRALPDGFYYVGATNRNQMPRLFPDVDCPDGFDRAPCMRGPGSDALLVEVVNGRLTANIDLVLTPLSTGLRGDVRTADSQPIDGVHVDIWDASTGAHVERIEVTSSNFAAELPPGGYFVSTHNDRGWRDEVYRGVICAEGSAWLGRCDPSSGTAVEVASPAFPFVSFRLTQRSARGDVPETSTPVQALRIPIGSSGAGPAASSSQATSRIHGTVTDRSGTPLQDIEVLLQSLFGNILTSTSTQADGSYLLDNLEPGYYVLVARSVSASAPYVEQIFDGIDCTPVCSNRSFDLRFDGGTPVPLAADSSVEDIDFRLRAGGLITGRVFTSGQRTGTNEPVPSGQVRFQNADGSLSGWLNIAADGTFASSPLPPGRYYLTAVSFGFEAQNYDRIPCPLDYTIAFRPFSCDPTQGRPVHVRAGQTTSSIDFYLRPWARISGYLYDAVSGEPLPGMTIEAVAPAFEQSWRTRSNRAGRYILDNLPVGTYFLRTLGAGGENYANVLYDGLSCRGACEPTKGKPILGDPGVDRTINLYLPRSPLRVFGTVRNAASGAVLHNIRVEVYDANGALVATTYSNFDGSYLINLPPGQYHVLTDNNLGFVDQVYPNQECPIVDGSSACDPGSGTPLTLDFETGQRADFSLRSVLAPN